MKYTLGKMSGRPEKEMEEWNYGIFRSKMKHICIKQKVEDHPILSFHPFPPIHYLLPSYLSLHSHPFIQSHSFPSYPFRSFSNIFHFFSLPILAFSLFPLIRPPILLPFSTQYHGQETRWWLCDPTHASLCCVDSPAELICPSGWALTCIARLCYHS